MNLPSSSPRPALVDARASRLLSLDVLRGLTVAFMILVNNAGDGHVSYAQLRHSRWNGCTLTDLVFPTFLFIVGASVELSFQTRLLRGASRTAIFGQAMQRALLIFALGLLLNALPFFHLHDLRYFGVLQRIALCYLITACIFLAGGLQASATCFVVCVAGYWVLLSRVTMPEYGLPGRDISLLDPAGNLASLLDRMLVAPAHLYHHGVYDPEGLLSTVPAVGTTLLGVCSAAVLRFSQKAGVRATILLATGLLLVAAGLLWSHSLPLNKRLWTSSYVLFAGGISTVLLAALFWVIDGPWQLRTGLTPALVLGTNALAAYILSEVLQIVLGTVPVGAYNLQQWLYALLSHTWMPAPLSSLLYSVLFVVVCSLPITLLYRRRIFVKL